MGSKTEHWAGIYTAELDDEVPIWFLDYERYFGRNGLYGDPRGDYPDNAFRFAFLSKAALQVCHDQQFTPDIIHVHDWHTALTPLFLHSLDKPLTKLNKTASVLTIHNIGYQGIHDPNVLGYIGASKDHFQADTLEDHGKVNFLKGGIAFADAITTVSPTHAQEIRDPVGGMGLAPMLNNRSSDLFGILNGADYEHWDPSQDPVIEAHYSQSNMRGKNRCKLALQKRFNLQSDKKTPIIGVVSRFASQKGFGLVQDALPSALNKMSFQLVVLGNGDPATEYFFHKLQESYPEQVGLHIGYSDKLSHMIQAGSDFFLMPSLYEPCGLAQIYALKYGTLPIVRATGGLDDTVENYNESAGSGTGFKFSDPTPLALYNTIGWAISTWFDRPKHITKLRKQAMAQHFDWSDSAQEYINIYNHAIRHRLRSG